MIVRLLECGHAAVSAASRLCAHLLVEEPPDYHRVLTGSGVRYDLACAECVDQPLLTACEGCAERAGRWADDLGWKGTPEVRHEDREPIGSVRSEICEVQPLTSRCLAPLPHGWLALTADGLVDLRKGIVCEVEPGHDALRTSEDGRYAAAVTDYGQRAVVVDLRSGGVVLELDRGAYHSDRTPFPLAFLPGDRVVAATAWNRLDVFDLPSGAVLTERQADGVHFRGALTPSPSGRWVLDGSWVVDVEAWLRDGGEPPSLRLARRGCAWDQPVAWVSEDLVAIQRIGDDDEAVLDGVELYSVPSGRRLEPFAGPAGRMWAHNGLLCVSGTDGFEIWDPGRGARVGLVPGFRPIAHRDGTFVSLGDGVLNSFSVD